MSVAGVGRIICVAVLMYTGEASSSQVGAVRGVVLGSLGNPVQGAKVKVGSHSRRTGRDGVFFVDDVSPGDVSISVESGSLRSTSAAVVEAGKIARLTITLDDVTVDAGSDARNGQPIVLEGVISHGTPAPTEDTIAVEIYGAQTYNSDIWLISKSGEVTSRLVRSEGGASNPRWSPDGTKIVYSNRLQRNLGNEIFVVDVGSGTQAKVAEGITPSFSPDGSAIIYSAKHRGNWDIYRLDLKSGREEAVTTDPVNELYPIWYRAGSQEKVTFSAKESLEHTAPYDLWEVDPSGSGRRRVTTVGRDTGGQVFGASRSASGDRMAFWILGMGNASAPPTIWVGSGDGSGAQQIIEDGANPEWGDADTVYYTSSRTGKQQLWRVNIPRAEGAGGPSSQETSSRSHTPHSS